MLASTLSCLRICSIQVFLFFLSYLLCLSRESSTFFGNTTTQILRLCFFPSIIKYRNLASVKKYAPRISLHNLLSELQVNGVRCDEPPSFKSDNCFRRASSFFKAKLIVGKQCLEVISISLLGIIIASIFEACDTILRIRYCSHLLLKSILAREQRHLSQNLVEDLQFHKSRILEVLCCFDEFSWSIVYA